MNEIEIKKSSKHDIIIATLALLGVLVFCVLKYLACFRPLVEQLPLYFVLIFGGLPLVFDLISKAIRSQFGADLLAGISIITAVILGEYLAGSLVVLMLSGGAALENFATSRASSVLKALAKRMPQRAQRRVHGTIEEIDIESIQIGDILIVFPHQICPVDGEVIEGQGAMDEAFLTGEPYQISKAPGSEVISGAINGEHALTIRATRLPIDSRYAKIAKVMHETQYKRLSLRRLGDQLGAWYTPLALAIACIAWVFADADRFLSVLVVATPCPLLIAIPVAVIGSISLAAKRGIIIRDPAVLEQVDKCRTIILDKTGTLTHGVPVLAEEVILGSLDQTQVLMLAATIEQYSKHPLANAILSAAKDRSLQLKEALEIKQSAGIGLNGKFDGHNVLITSRKYVQKNAVSGFATLPQSQGGLECVVVVDQQVAALYRFRDLPRANTKSFIKHLGKLHSFTKVMIVSGDRESEVKELASKVGIDLIYGGKSPEEKVEIVKSEAKLAPVLFLGDGINDAPALLAATVGIAFGHQSDITSEAAGAVIMDTSLEKVDEFFHISRRMRSIALQSAIGGMALSIGGMFIAGFGFLPPVSGAIAQEVIDLFAVLNALRVAYEPRELTDFA